ncbi:hydrogenase nickel incorporation protein HypB [Rubinisphaera sp.]|uniref:hydrogenase nickel incorporation protein HypB n=1 Tax=Rubinisphaera sp. TaxID=2024857 RepID=UPI000C0F6DB6|nr:hydrogenase nickel incorporation protein HypB [Rubinisphaera sp.]MBV08738.1 hydrogenase accessory protein HypB [Rubinisphaera sp.]HCS53678.1 hydrogenase accessory protein HypB [Planctomycetaceae bacterium]|tara:strand:+ start:82 stop:741 length:660 start_codon:yes stop_codon:yes gene_type:complete
MNQTITVNRDLKADLKEQANRFRQRMSDQGTLVVNLVSSPGAGKTSLLQRTATKIGDEYRLAVLVGDLATDRDAERLKPYVPVQQLTTGGACHLEIPLVESGYERLNQSDLDILFIENVGNLVCPASHDLGEYLRVTLLSVTEGDDKPGKYPKMFRTSQAMVITKSDLLPYVPFDVSSAVEDARRIQPELDFLTTSSQTLAGVDEWCEFLVRQLRKIQK